MMVECATNCWTHIRAFTGMTNANGRQKIITHTHYFTCHIQPLSRWLIENSCLLAHGKYMFALLVLHTKVQSRPKRMTWFLQIFISRVHWNYTLHSRPCFFFILANTRKGSHFMFMNPFTFRSPCGVVALGSTEWDLFQVAHRVHLCRTLVRLLTWAQYAYPTFHKSVALTV